jgi:hypothetical protein
MDIACEHCAKTIPAGKPRWAWWDRDMVEHTVCSNRCYRIAYFKMPVNDRGDPIPIKVKLQYVRRIEYEWR